MIFEYILYFIEVMFTLFVLMYVTIEEMEK